MLQGLSVSLSRVRRSGRQPVFYFFSSYGASLCVGRAAVHYDMLLYSLCQKGYE